MTVASVAGASLRLPAEAWRDGMPERPVLQPPYRDGPVGRQWGESGGSRPDPGGLGSWPASARTATDSSLGTSPNIGAALC